jgi:glycosyltransferase involved in cell wall biosynthesis
MSILEAMAEARPVVATGVGGVPEVLRGVGLVSPPGAVHALAGSVAFLLRNPLTARQLGRLGRERVRRSFDGDVHVERYRELFGSYLDQGRTT